MARKVAPCGTVTAYNRHRRHKEDPCNACREAKRDDKREGRDKARRESADAVASSPVTTTLDRLSDAEANLAHVVQVMESGAALNQTAPLSKRRQELQEYIYQLKSEAESGAEVSRYDEIAARRRRRQSAA